MCGLLKAGQLYTVIVMNLMIVLLLCNLILV